MDIYKKLPQDIKNKLFMYFEHPIVTLLNKENYFWVKNKLRCPPILSFKKRFYWAWIVYHPLTTRRQRCGCYWYEQHQCLCDDMELEELEGWDPAVKATPLMQALDKAAVMKNLRKRVYAICLMDMLVLKN